MGEKKITLAILNITSWAGLCADATHVYGKLILCDKESINLDNVTEWNVNHLGDDIELRQPMTLQMAIKLDAKDGGKTYQRAVRLRATFENDPDFEELYNTNRFDTFEEVENFAIAKWKELKLDCPFISLYESNKYDFTDRITGEICKTKIIYPEV